MIYFISDTHFHHHNIINYCNRPFKDVNEMNKIIINNWNNIVTENDTVYHLGDFCLFSDEEIKNIFNKLNGNKILIRGNHEYLIEELCRRGYPLSHDDSNGTSKTVMDLDLEAKNWDVACETTMTKLKPLLNQMVNYFETDKYIFVHSWIPCIGDGKPMYHVRNRHFEYDPNWRNAHQAQWEGATWGNPLIMA